MSDVETSTSGTSPVGTVLHEGSSQLCLTPRERQVAELVGCGWSYKKIGSELGITKMSVAVHVSHIAQRIPGDGNPRLQVAAWMWQFGAFEDNGNSR